MFSTPSQSTIRALLCTFYKWEEGIRDRAPGPCQTGCQAESCNLNSGILVPVFIHLTTEFSSTSFQFTYNTVDSRNRRPTCDTNLWLFSKPRFFVIRFKPLSQKSKSPAEIRVLMMWSINRELSLSPVCFQCSVVYEWWYSNSGVFLCYVWSYWPALGIKKSLR